jgi:uncharacterized protein YdhG (YjbR/CyaY superfamily)
LRVDGATPARRSETMASKRKPPGNIDDYISGFTPEVQLVLKRIRSTIRKAAPSAQEIISYQMPAFTQDGILVYFAAFKQHVGLYPPVRGDAVLMKRLTRYAGPKGNLQFPLDEPIPYALIARIVRLRVKQNLAKAAARKPKRPKAR